jgi:EpsI family protein
MRPATTIMVRFESVLRPVNIIFPLVLLILVLYHQTASSLWWLWTDPNSSTYSHGPLLLAVCAVLFYRQWRREVNAWRLRPDIIGIVLLACTSLAWFLADLVHVQIVEQLMLPVLLAFMLWAVLGYRGARSLAFPILLLIFAIPIWDPLTAYLQSLTAHAVALMLNFTGFTAVLEGVYILVPAGTFEVALSCSGLAQFIVAVMVAVLYTHINGLRRQTGLWLTAVAIAIALLTNILRIYIVVVAGQLTNMQHYFVTQDHWTLGWVLFGIAMFVFVLLANRLVALVPRDSMPDSPLRQGQRGPTSSTHRNPLSPLHAALPAFLAVTIGPALAYHYEHRGDTTPLRKVALADRVTARITPWHANSSANWDYRPSFVKPDEEYGTLYRAENGPAVYVYVAYYARQEQGKEAVYYLNRVYDDKHWKAAGVANREVHMPLSSPLTVRETRIHSNDGREKLVWQWYYVHRWRTSDDYMAKLLNLWGTLRNDPSIAAIVIAADLHGSTDNSRALLRRFLSDNIQAIEHAVDDVRLM